MILRVRFHLRDQKTTGSCNRSFDPPATISWMLINSLVEHRLDWLLVSFQRLSSLPPPLSLLSSEASRSTRWLFETRMYKWNATSISINCFRQIAGCRFTKRDPFTTLRYADSLGNDERNSSVVSRFFPRVFVLRMERSYVVKGQSSLSLFLYCQKKSKERSSRYNYCRFTNVAHIENQQTTICIQIYIYVYLWV